MASLISETSKVVGVMEGEKILDSEPAEDAVPLHNSTHSLVFGFFA